MTDSTPTTAAGWTRNAIQEINTGEHSDARQMLAAALRLDPNYVTAWIWFGSIATDEAEQRYCYERAVEIDPASVVAERLARIKTTESRPPAELQDLEAPPLPEEFGGAQLEKAKPSRAWWPLVLISAVVLVILFGGIWALWPRSEDRGEPIYLAFVAGLTGTGAESALQMERALGIYVDYVNRSGGVEGRPIEVVSFDDQDNEDRGVEVANEIVEDGRFVAVVGHRFSGPAIAAAPIYQAAGIPMIAPSATADGLTEGCDWCFRTVFDNHTQGRMIASYVRGVLDDDEVVLIVEESSYGESLADGFAIVYEEAGGSIDATYTLPADPSVAGATMQQAAEAIASEHEGKLVVMAANVDLAGPLLIALRTAGIDGTIFGSDSVGAPSFLESVNAAAAEQGLGVVTNGLYASAPVFSDSLNGDAVRLADRFEDDFGIMPTWRALTTADAGVAIVSGLEAQGLAIERMPITEQREAIREFLNTLTSPDTSIPGFVGPIYFDASRTAQRPVTIGIASGDFYNSAPRQLVPLTAHIQDEARDVETIRVGGSRICRPRADGIRLQSDSGSGYGVRHLPCDLFRLVQILRR
ncbi:MAG: ABC transporter substrate-binding protein [Thermomicrobiales bacterium]|nr:ABC transporter substrate-binding protein [Thermomicrobiales bacterium]